MKKHFSRYLAIFIMMLAGTLQAAADLTFSQVASGFPIVGTDANAMFVVDANDAEVVTTAARCVIRDIKAVTGTSLPLPLQRRGESSRHLAVDFVEQLLHPSSGGGRGGYS